MSIVFRNDSTLRNLFKNKWIEKLSGADQLIYLNLTQAGKKVYCIQEYLGTYRIHAGGIWSGTTPFVRIEKTNTDIELYKRHLPLTFVQRQQLNFLYKKNIVSYLSYKLNVHRKPALWKRSILFALNYCLFPFGPGVVSGITANAVRKLVFQNKN